MKFFFFFNQSTRDPLLERFCISFDFDRLKTNEKENNDQKINRKDD